MIGIVAQGADDPQPRVDAHLVLDEATVHAALAVGREQVGRAELVDYRHLVLEAVDAVGQRVPQAGGVKAGRVVDVEARGLEVEAAIADRIGDGEDLRLIVRGRRVVGLGAEIDERRIRARECIAEGISIGLHIGIAHRVVHGETVSSEEVVALDEGRRGNLGALDWTHGQLGKPAVILVGRVDDRVAATVLVEVRVATNELAVNVDVAAGAHRSAGAGYPADTVGADGSLLLDGCGLSDCQHVIDVARRKRSDTANGS